MSNATSQAAAAAAPNENLRGGGYVRRTSVKLSNAELIFDHMKFVTGKGDKEKVILSDVGARVTSGRVLAMMGPSGT